MIQYSSLSFPPVCIATVATLNEKSSKVICHEFSIIQSNIGGLVQERHTSIDNALELRISCTQPSIYTVDFVLLCLLYSKHKRPRLSIPQWLVCWKFVKTSFVNTNGNRSCGNTARCRYNAVNFLQNPHKRHPIGRPLVYKLWLYSTFFTATMHATSCYWVVL